MMLIVIMMTFQVASMIMNAGLWFMKHAAMLAARPEPAMEEAKEVHTCLRKAAGLVKFVQDSLVPQLSEKTVDGGDLDGRVCTAYINQVRVMITDTPPRKLESKIFCVRTSVIHYQKRISSGFPGVCDFKSVCGA